MVPEKCVVRGAGLTECVGLTARFEVELRDSRGAPAILPDVDVGDAVATTLGFAVGANHSCLTAAGGLLTVSVRPTIPCEEDAPAVLPPSELTLVDTCNAESRFAFEYQAGKFDRVALDIQVLGQHISGSPFLVPVKPEFQV